jgi:hypothetical protein
MSGLDHGTRRSRRGPDGKPAVVGGTVNIQARVVEAALQAMKNAHGIWRMLCSLCNVPVWAKDLKQRYIFANRAVVRRC